MLRRHQILYVSLQLCVQNQRKKWNFPLNFQTMRKLSEHYSRIFQTQSSGCASGVDHFRNFTKLKILNIWIVKYLLNCKRYLSYNFRIFQKISECWVLENLDVHLEWTTSELEFKSEKSKIVTFSLEFNGQVLVRQDYILYLYSLQSILNLTPAFVISCCVQVEQGNVGMGEDGRCTSTGSSPYLFVVHVLTCCSILKPS